MRWKEIPMTVSAVLDPAGRRRGRPEAIARHMDADALDRCLLQPSERAEKLARRYRSSVARPVMLRTALMDRV
jgi:hypothetical protein